jgi:hypothetical protein
MVITMEEEEEEAIVINSLDINDKWLENRDNLQFVLKVIFINVI